MVVRTSSVVAPLILLVLVACGTGATGKSSEHYRPPSDHDVSTERILDVPFEEAWHLYVSKLSESPFVISNMSKESRIINVSFNVHKPSEYIDCGYATRTNEHPSLGMQTYSYETADDSSFKAFNPGTDVLWSIRRETSLEVHASVHMVPVSHRTEVRVNARYDWNNAVSGSSNAGGVLSETSSMVFSTKETATRKDLAGDGTPTEWACRSRGVIERQLLQLI